MSSDNVAGIQAQHKTLEEKINTICTNLKSRSGIDSLKDQLDDLAGFLQTHNKEEEKLMKSYSYDGFETHEREHKKLLNKLFSLRDQSHISLEEEHKQALLGFLETDLMDHVTQDVKTWEDGEINREFVYQRLHHVALDSTNSTKLTAD